MNVIAVLDVYFYTIVHFIWCFEFFNAMKLTCVIKGGESGGFKNG